MMCDMYFIILSLHISTKLINACLNIILIFKKKKFLPRTLIDIRVKHYL